MSKRTTEPRSRAAPAGAARCGLPAAPEPHWQQAGDDDEDRETVLITQVSKRLGAEFGRELSRASVQNAVREPIRLLDSSPVAALPELAERLARQRLVNLPARLVADTATVT